MDEENGAMAGDNGDAPAERNPSVFLSYSRTDLERARPVIALLEAAGFDLWWDGRLEGGENYLATTEDRLESADCVAVLWSQTSVASHWVRDEAQRGRERGCLVPLSLDGTMAPLLMRAASSATSEATASNLRTKYASASSGLFPGYEPTGFSPDGVRT